MPYTWMGMFVMRVMIPRGIIAPGRAMTISGIDWAIVAAYFLLSAGIGLYFTRRGGESLDQYFLSGRQAPWWLARTAMVATTFAADTPLVVTGLVASKGVAGNWLWWNFVMSGIDRKSTRLNSSHGYISYAVFCLKKKKQTHHRPDKHQQRPSYSRGSHQH